MPERGAIEPMLAHREGEYRYLIEGNYKIIYRIADSETVLVVNIFDTRQDPSRM